jgi:hypothetical protein
MADPRQRPELRVVLAADNCTAGGEVRIRASIDGYGDREATIPVEPSGFCPSTKAATAVFALDDLPVGEHHVRVFVSGNRPYIAAQLEFAARPPRLIDSTATKSTLSISRGLELEVQDVRLEFPSADVCDEYEVQLIANAYGAGGTFSLRVVTDWADEVTLGPFETAPRTAAALLPRAPLGQHTVRVFLKHNGSGLYSYGLRLVLNAQQH